MALVINTNIPSLMAQRNILENMTPLQQAMERLSSGLRVNNAADDAAGLAIATRMTAQISGMAQAIRNTNDGVSLVQTAEGSLVEITDNLQRIRVLAVQAASATVTDAERETMQVEVEQLIAEIGRVAGQSNFNAVNLLDGTFKNKAFQVGANIGETITIDSIVNARTTELGHTAFTEAMGPTTVNNIAIAGTGDLTINATAIIASVNDGSGADHADASALAKATAINASGVEGVTATAHGGSAAGAVGTTGNLAVGAIQINGVSVGAVAAGDDLTEQAANVAAAINAANIDGIEASARAAEVTVTSTDGRNIDITVAPAAADAAGISTGHHTGRIELRSFADEGIVIGGGEAEAGAAAAAELIGFQNRPFTPPHKIDGIAHLDITTVHNANLAISGIDNALADITSGRGALGAIQNRFMSTISDLQVTVENLTASRSRIMDADFAAETANMTKAMIIQQSGISVLAQANIMPQNILALLG
ncbi:hypothetical protein M1N00_03985 [Thermodesulfovibrionales bacterium]|nr:hypothetical protein [Thermodesulfovibrionales bacterium]